jgi:hypothetical protein
MTGEHLWFALNCELVSNMMAGAVDFEDAGRQSMVPDLQSKFGW